MRRSETRVAGRARWPLESPRCARVRRSLNVEHASLRVTAAIVARGGHAQARAARIIRATGASCGCTGRSASGCLLWPTLWALWIAVGRAGRTQRCFLILVLGTIVVRSAGCVINDFADRKIDPHVARTADRPLATGEVAPVEALLLFAALMLIALGLGADAEQADADRSRSPAPSSRSSIRSRSASCRRRSSCSASRSRGACRWRSRRRPATCRASAGCCSSRP